MPATSDYPANLPDFIVGKTRTKVDEYLSSPDSALINHELITRNDIVYFDVSVICNSGCIDEPALFEDWLFTNPTKSFNKTIVTEFGRQQYSVAISSMPNEPIQIAFNSWRYDFQIYAERLLTDKEGFDRTLIDRYDLESPYIDIAVNNFWPEVQ